MSGEASNDRLTFWTEGSDCCDPVWEAAYNRFESAKEERAKFRRRLRALGIDGMAKNTRVADLFCGRGSNLAVLEEWGFADVIGVDLSPALLRQYKGKAKLYVGDCRDLKLPDASRDIVIVQGGLHHLPKLPEDLDRCLAEIDRVLTPGGFAAFVEPWDTSFLRLAHACCRKPFLRKIYPKLDALAVMIDHERATYEAWLAQPKLVRELADKHFDAVLDKASFGKWYYLGQKRAPGMSRKPFRNPHY